MKLGVALDGVLYRKSQIENSISCLRAINQYCDVFVFSERGDFYERILSDGWNMPKNRLKQAISGEEKYRLVRELEIECFIEDSPEDARIISRQAQVVLYMQPYNECPDFLRFKKWEDLKKWFIFWGFSQSLEEQKLKR